MLVSVVICTWNRCESLRRTLESLRSLVVPPEVAWEVVVVNNNSSDATDDVIASLQERLPLRRVFEREPGLSRARNAGVAASRGELLLFTDDDVRIDPNWMAAYLDAARQWPNAGYFGGEIRPHFADDVPKWVRRHQDALRGMLCMRDCGPELRALPPREFPWGPNMAVRRAAFARASFDEDLGRSGRGQMRGSEDSFFRNLERQGVSGVWVPAAKGSHHIPRSRATIRYLWQYYQGTGRGSARLAYPAERQWRDHLPPTLRALRALVTQWREWPRHLARVAKETGRLLESRRLARRRDNAASEIPA